MMPNSSQPGAVGFILAGGQSTRMGQDKALLEFCGRPLIAHAISILQDAGLSASIAGARAPLDSFAPVIVDPRPDLGPLSGVCAALASTSAHHAVFLSVDLPFVPSSLLRFLLHHARITGCAVTVPAVAGFAQTFPAVIDRAALPTLQAELDAGRYGCFAAFEAAAASLDQSIRSVSVEYLSQAGQVTHPHCLPPVYWFLNLNTPADLERAEALARRRIA
jgi:molybdenum cofactor guanylyltransferase